MNDGRLDRGCHSADSVSSWECPSVLLQQSNDFLGKKIGPNPDLAACAEALLTDG